MKNKYQDDGITNEVLCTIAKNLWLNNSRKKKREISSEGVQEPIRDSKMPFEQAFEEKDMSMHIHRVLHTMNEPYKEVFSLRVFGQLSFADIAGFFRRQKSGRVVSMALDIELGFISINYEDGRYTKWDLDGNVIDEK